MPLLFTHEATELENDLETPVGAFIRLVGENQGILLESAEVDGRWGRYSIIATDFLLTLCNAGGKLAMRVADEALAPLMEHDGKDFLPGLRALMDDIGFADEATSAYPSITRALYGYLGYGVVSMLEPKLAPVMPPEDAETTLVLPGTIVLFDHGYNRIIRLTTLLSGRAPASLPAMPVAGAYARPQGALAERKEYVAAVNRVKEMIRQGEAIQVVLSVPFSAPLAESPFNLYRRLRRLNPSPYMIYMHLPDGVLIASSPEVMVTCTANRLRLCPIAGTRPRSKTLSEDTLFGDELLQDPKERAEHVMLVDLGRNDLGRIAKAGSVKLERFMEVERFSHVMHLTSRIEADIAQGHDIPDILAATFPAGTVSGAPKIRAMEIVAEAEQLPRGPYAGAAGWLGLDKNALHLDLGIIIRSLWVRGGQAHWQAGAGIVFDSEAESEWRECAAKAAVIADVVLGGGAAKERI